MYLYKAEEFVVDAVVHLVDVVAVVHIEAEVSVHLALVQAELFGDVKVACCRCFLQACNLALVDGRCEGEGFFATLFEGFEGCRSYVSATGAGVHR